MSGRAICAEGLGKSFLMSAREERGTLLAAARRWVTGNSAHRVLWALRGVDLDIQKGETFGIIGPNGAGKSTLLLLLAGILAPSEGRVEACGKVDPFFQLAAGLQGRLSVMDNLSLCSALLGMSRRDFRAKLGRIVEFSGLGDYLYACYGELSTGMAARLPFSVAVHADLDVLLLDEMLSVGDRDFQARCFKVFEDLRAQGKTLIIVSHNLELIRNFCGRALYLRAGVPVFSGPAAEAVDRLIKGG
ncbi:MAG: ABC transporter ATP-binding protein [Elusimicrobiota bacterium]|jgi:ABC-type polysaccharide/polyol phosphate transport system ATPase subunit